MDIILFSIAMFFLIGGTHHSQSPAIFSLSQEASLGTAGCRQFTSNRGGRWTTVETDEAAHLEQKMDNGKMPTPKAYMNHIG